MTAHRFRFFGERGEDGVWRLVADDAHHLAKVLRLAEGAEVEVANGRGWWAPGRVTAIRGKEVLVAEDELHEVAAAAWPVIFAVGALKPGAVDEILPALTELGVDEVWVFGQEGAAKVRLADKAVERWQRILVAAVKQCKRAWVPELRVFGSIKDMIAAVPQGVTRVVLSGETERSLLEVGQGARGLVMVAGGEKGLDVAEETTLREAGFTEARIGGHVLRAVTAAVAAAAVAAVLRGR